MTKDEFERYILGGFDNPSDCKEYLDWVNSRPEKVQNLIYRYPIGWRTIIGGITFHIIGYTETDELIVSPLNPKECSGDEELRSFAFRIDARDLEEAEP